MRLQVPRVAFVFNAAGLFIIVFILLFLPDKWSTTNSSCPPLESSAVQSDEKATKVNLAAEKAFSTQLAVCQYARASSSDFTLNGKLRAVKVSKFPKTDAFLDRAISPVNMYVYSSKDIVSGQIISNGEWDGDKLQKVIKALTKVQKQRPIGAPPVTFLDIGGNVGWFTLGAASAGFRVVTFELMSNNIVAIRNSLCNNPPLMDRVVLHNVGLGSNNTLCQVVSDANNEGDGSTVCSSDMKMDSRYFERDGSVQLVRLDDYMIEEHDVAVVKIDVEGFEAHVLAGGQNTLLQRRVPYIVTEFAPFMLISKKSVPEDFIEQFVSAGYAVSLNQFDDPNPMLRSEWIKLSEKSNILVDLFLTYVGSEKIDRA